VGQVPASQMHTPPLQRRPTAHWELLPQRQLPELEQESARTGSQATHTPPVIPQVAKAEAVHPDAVQHPPAQLVGSQATQAPAMHVCPVVHAGPVPQEQAPPTHPSASVEVQAAQVAPAVPQEVRSGGA